MADPMNQLYVARYSAQKMAITELQEALDIQYSARLLDLADVQKIVLALRATCLIGTMTADDPILNAITEAQRALDAVHAAYS